MKGRLAALQSKNIPLRLRQFERISDPPFVFAVAKAVVTGKIAICAEVLARHQRNHPECSLRNEISQLSALGDRVGQIQTMDSLRGVEGQAAAVYFQGFARMLRRGMQVQRRTRRPPTDPVNSLLSFGYTLLYNALGCARRFMIRP